MDIGVNCWVCWVEEREMGKTVGEGGVQHVVKAARVAAAAWVSLAMGDRVAVSVKAGAVGAVVIAIKALAKGGVTRAEAAATCKKFNAVKRLLNKDMAR